MREWLADLLESLCARTHWIHRLNLVPMSWFDEDKYPGWRGRLCHLIYGCPLTDLAWKVGRWDASALRVKGTPWEKVRRDYDDPYGDGMDSFGDPTDWNERE